MLTNVAESELLPSSADCEARQVSPIDLKHLRRYTMGDVALEQEVLELFLGQLPQTIQALSDAATEREWRMAAHTLKGSGRAVGAWRVARLAERAERHFNLNNRVMCAKTVAGMREAAEEARIYIRATCALSADGDQ